MKYKLIIVTLFLLIYGSSSYANTVENNTYLTVIHFSSHAYGKNVVAVYGHLGILMTDDDFDSFWQDSKHIEMKRVGNHYFGKAVLNANTGRGYPDMVGPRIQYWVHFEDGSKIITDAYEIPVYQVVVDDTDIEKRAMSEFAGRGDTWRTEAVRITRNR